MFILSKNNLIKVADLYTESSKLGICYCEYANAWITGGCCCGQIAAKIWRPQMEVWDIVAPLEQFPYSWRPPALWTRWVCCKTKAGAGPAAAFHPWTSTRWTQMNYIVLAASKGSASPAEKKLQVPWVCRLRNHWCPGRSQVAVMFGDFWGWWRGLSCDQTSHPEAPLSSQH